LKPDRKWLYPFQWLKFSLSHARWLFLSNSSEGGPVDIFKCGSRKEKYLGLLWSHFWIDINKFYTKTFRIVYILIVYFTGTCFIQKIYAPSSSLLQGQEKKRRLFRVKKTIIIFEDFLI
jgi:hypothetical protein